MVVFRKMPAPLGTPIANRRRPEYKNTTDPQEGMLSGPWIDYFTAQSNQLDSTAGVAFSVGLLDQDASIGLTDISDGALGTGLYRVNTFGVVVQAGLVADLDITFVWTYRGNTVTYTYPKIDGTILSDFQGPSFLLNADGPPLQYSTVYASGGPPFFIYDLFIQVEQLH